MTWIDQQDQTKIDEALTALREQAESNKNHAAKDCLKYAGSDERFALWLYQANRICLRRYEVGIFDLSDHTWRDSFDNGDSPRDALGEAIAGDDLYSLMGEE